MELKHSNTPPYTSVDISNQQVVKPVENQVQNNECSILTDVLSHEDIATMNQLVSELGVNKNKFEILLQYYELEAGTQCLNNGLVKISKRILAKTFPKKDVNKKDKYMRCEYHADKVQLFQINNDITTMPSSPDADTMFAAIVVLPNEETKCMCIESNILPRGKNAKNIIKQLQEDSVYWLNCKNSCKNSGQCRRNSTNCLVHCATHKLKPNDNSTNSHVVVFSYKINHWGDFLPPGDTNPSDTSIVLKFNEKIYKSVPCDGDGACLFYSVSNYIIDNEDKERFSNVPKFNDHDSLVSSGILDRIWDFISEITSDDMDEIIDLHPMEDIEKGAQQWEKTLPGNVKHSEWAKKFMTEITNSWHTKTDRYPMESHALFLSWIFKIRIQIIRDCCHKGYHCEFDSNSLVYCCPPVKNIDHEFSDTCVLLHCHGSIPLYTCHWLSRYIHYEYLQPMQNPTAEVLKNAYTGRGGTLEEGLDPYRIYDNIHNSQVSSEGTSTVQNSLESSSSGGTSSVQKTSEMSTKNVTLLGVG